MPFHGSLTQQPMPRLKLLWRRLTARSLWVLIIPTMLLAACSVGNLGTSSTTNGGTGPDACVGGKPTSNSSGDLGTPISGGTVIGAVPGSQIVNLNIALNLNRQALDTCLNAIYDPSSVNYHHFLSPSDIATRFAPSAADVAKVTKYLTDQGLAVTQTYKTNAAISVQGTATQVEKAFSLNLQQYQKNGGTIYQPDKAATLPTDIQGLVQSISGLISNAPVNCGSNPTPGPLQCSYIRHSGGPILPTGMKLPAQPKAPSVDGDCTFAATGTPLIGSAPDGSKLLEWSDLRQAYGLTNLASGGFDGSGTSIGFVEFDPYARQDVVNYMLCAGTYDPNRLVNIDVVPGLQPGAGAGEATLDVEMAAGMTSKNTKIIAYNAPNDAQWTTSLQDILHKVASDKQVSVLSISYGDFEQDLSPTYREAVNESMKLLASEGISTFVASGDCGAFGAGQYGTKVVDFPASAPWAIAVGGTRLTTDPLAGTRQSEVVWGNSSPDKTTCSNTWGSGGGVSGEPSFTIPTWQKGPGVSNTYSTGARQVPDVAAAAINISIYYSGLWLMTGGTSAAAPIWATGTDIMNQALAAKGKALMGGVPTIYQLANSSNYSKLFNDVTSGNNQYYPATPGWDFTSGWGSPNFDQIATALGA